MGESCSTMDISLPAIDMVLTSQLHWQLLFHRSAQLGYCDNCSQHWSTAEAICSAKIGVFSALRCTTVLGATTEDRADGVGSFGMLERVVKCHERTKEPPIGTSVHVSKDS